ncbi:MAG: ATP-binding protein [Gammaproteobacteria bacterium]|nr:ATP-binding protein [Gammaproteobacteria bacterium]
MADPDPWHFGRSSLARRTLTLLAVGPARALTLFAPRRTGKTEFLIKDLGPAAEADGHRAIYVSFWQSPLSPLATLLHALETSLRQGTFYDRLRQAGSALSPKLQLSIPMIGRTEVDVGDLRGRPPDDLLLHLDELLGRVSMRNKPTILLLDEVQELARSGDNHALVAALRTSLDKRPDNLRSVFTGSSREGLAAMFAARQAPFFHFATPIDLPPLGEPFVDHILKTMANVAQRRPNRQEMLTAFNDLHGNPYYFRTLVESMLLNPGLTTAAALLEVRHRIAAELGFPNIWLSLTPLQRAVAQALLEHGKPFGQSARTAMAEHLEEEIPSPGRVQAALRRLQRLDLVDRQNGGWRITDPEWADWVRKERA